MTELNDGGVEQLPEWAWEYQWDFIDHSGGYDHQGWLEFLGEKGLHPTTLQERRAEDYGAQRARDINREEEA